MKPLRVLAIKMISKINKIKKKKNRFICDTKNKVTQIKNKSLIELKNYSFISYYLHIFCSP